MTAPVEVVYERRGAGPALVLLTASATTAAPGGPCWTASPRRTT
ncbi:hypothetical protein V2I01_40310 [Micromonospora sp. BRA006-A]|nr:hypothetical protein [Micromonospora sp. BRA006-A]